MSRRGACGRADLLRAFAAGGTDLLEATAERLGYAQVVTGSHQVISPPILRADPVFYEPEITPATILTQPLAEIPFWRPVRYELLARSSRPVETAPPAAPPEWRDRPTQAPVHKPLAPWRDIQPRLRNGLAVLREGGALDIGRILRRIGRGEPLRHLPHRLHRCWGPQLQIIIDRSEHLVPFWTDQERVVGDLLRLFGRHDVELAVFHEGLDEPRPLDHSAGPYRPPSGGTVLVLGDLGCLGGNEDVWRSLGGGLAETGGRAVALLPAPLSRCPRPLRRLWRVIPWERPRGTASHDRDALRARAERLLRLVSPAVRVEPGLLRAVRLMLDDADAGTEADVWRHPVVTSTSSVAASLDPKAAKALQADFSAEQPALQTAVLGQLRQWHAPLPTEIMAEEIVRLPPNPRSACRCPRIWPWPASSWRSSAKP